MAENTQKDPQDWVSGDDPMTGAAVPGILGDRFARLGGRHSGLVSTSSTTQSVISRVSGD